MVKKFGARKKLETFVPEMRIQCRNRISQRITYYKTLLKKNIDGFFDAEMKRFTKKLSIVQERNKRKANRKINLADKSGENVKHVENITENVAGNTETPDEIENVIESNRENNLDSNPLDDFIGLDQEQEQDKDKDGQQMQVEVQKDNNQPKKKFYTEKELLSILALLQEKRNSKDMDFYYNLLLHFAFKRHGMVYEEFLKPHAKSFANYNAKEAESLKRDPFFKLLLGNLKIQAALGQQLLDCNLILRVELQKLAIANEEELRKKEKLLRIETDPEGVAAEEEQAKKRKADRKAKKRNNKRKAQEKEKEDSNDDVQEEKMREKKKAKSSQGNRMGQQARRALWEKTYGEKANHIIKTKVEEKVAKKVVDPTLHPSWLAKKQNKVGILPATGTKIVFD